MTDYIVPDPVNAPSDRHQRPAADPEIYLPCAQACIQELLSADDPLLAAREAQDQVGRLTR